MGEQIVEKKAYFLGSWQQDRVDNSVIAHINSKIQDFKGSKVRLQLSADGLRVVKNTMIQGKMLQDFITLRRIQIMTVSQNMPNILIVTALSAEPTYKYIIQAYRCQNGIDSGMYLNLFRSMLKSSKPVGVVRVPKKDVKGGEDDINWTLRSKDYDNSKRELKQFVNLQGEGVVVQKVTDDDKKEVFQNGHSEVYENGVRIPLYRKGRPQQRAERESLDNDLDSRSEVSESALRAELESLSHELRDIKIMLENTTGLNPNSEPNTPRDFKPVNVKVNTHTVQPETFVYKTPEDKMDAVVVEDDEVQMRSKPIGYHTVTNGNVTHVRVSVPDYRIVSDRSNEAPEPVDRPVIQSGFDSISSRSTTMTSYESWKKNTMERNTVKYNDLPERIQWKSRPNRASHVVSVRPRSAIPTWSHDVTDGTQRIEVRHHTVGMGPHYQKVYNPRTVQLADRKTQSLRLKTLPTTVVKPIEKVYKGRPDARHSIAYRPNSAHARGTILVREEPSQPQVVYVEQNNNVVKVDNSDDQLLDVSGMDLYSETPSQGVVIHT